MCGMKWDLYDIRGLSAAEYDRYHALMAPEKRRRVDRFRFPDDKKRTIAAELLARRAVAEWCGVDEEGIVFDLGPHLKPFARGLPVEFSVSHSCDLAVCAVDGRPVGIDVEKIRPIDLRVAKRVCTAAELKYLFGRPPEPADFAYAEDPALLERFYTLWTRKEAFGKCGGQGLARPGLPLPETGFQTFRRGEYAISVYQNCFT